MFNNQSKNTIKAITAVFVTLVLGEGILGWGIYWPFLLVLLDWEGIYWLSLVVGIIISVFRGISVGLPSLFLLLVIGGLSITINARKEMGWIVIVLSVVANFIFDKVFGLNWSFWELGATVLAGFLAVKWFEKVETISINY